MTGSSRCLVFLIFLAGGSSEVLASHYTAVRWLSGQDYAQTNHLRQSSLSPPPPSSLSLARAGVSGRPLFSWDLPSGSGITAERVPQSTPSDFNLKTGYQFEKNQIKDGVKYRPRNVWWPWKNYKEWSRSRGQNNELKQVHTNNSSKSSIHPRISMVTKLKKRNKKKHRKTNHNKKHKNKKPKSKLKTAEDIINLQTNYEQIISRIMFNISAKYINKTATSNDTNCIVFGKEHCNRYVDNKDELKTIHTKSDTINNYETKTFNRIQSSERSYPLITDYLKQSSVFMRKEDYAKGDGNECLENNGGCAGLCINLLETSTCQCPAGFRLDTSRKKCQDINECIARNGHGPCQGECTNTRGSYHCSCANLTGTRLANDGHSCEDIDECNSDTNRLNCSHGCINTVGTAFCHCSDGYELGSDWRTCQDIDECASVELQSEKCLRGCVNTEGSYKCL